MCEIADLQTADKLGSFHNVYNTVITQRCLYATARVQKEALLAKDCRGHPDNEAEV